MLVAAAIVSLAAGVAVAVPAPVNAWASLLEQHGAVLGEQQVQSLCIKCSQFAIRCSFFGRLAALLWLRSIAAP